MNPPRRLWKFTVFLVALLLAFAGAAGYAGSRLYQARLESTLREQREQLAAIVDAKEQQVNQWRRYITGTGATIAANALFSRSLISATVGTLSAADRASLLEWMAAFRDNHGHMNVILTDTAGAVRLALDPATRLPASEVDLVREAIGGRRPLLADIHEQGISGVPHMSLAVPLYDTAGRAAGALLFWINPYASLFPIIQSWPTSSPSAEVLLVRRDGDQVTYLNELRHAKGTALKLKLPLSRTELPAVRAVLRGQGSGEGVDYRGVPVVAAWKPVPGSSWHVVGKIDRSEILASIKTEFRLLAVVIGLLVVLAAMAAGFAWRRREMSLYQRAYQETLAREQAEREARLLTDVIMASRNEIYLFDAENWRFRFVNEGALRNLGYTLDELRQMTPMDLKPGVTQRDLLARLSPLTSGDKPVNVFETTHRRSNGSSYPVEVRLQYFDRDGDRVYLAVVQDISDRKRAEAATRESEQRYRLAVENSPVGIFVQTRGRFSYLNPAALRMFGAENLGQMAGTPVLERMHPDFREVVHDRIRRLNELREPVSRLEEIWLKLDGTPFPVDVSAVPIRQAGEDGALVFCDDLSERKQAEQARLSLEQQLLQARKLESVGRLAGGVAHDFNNHLTVINGYCDMSMEMLSSEDPLHHRLAEIRKAGEKAAVLTRQLLAFSRRQIIEPKPLDLNAVVADLHKMLARIVGEDIDLVTALQPNLGRVLADEGQIGQVIVNLAANARDAMPKGGRLLIETSELTLDESYAARHADVRPGPYIQLAVTDTGVGMDKETQEHIFEPFFTTKEKGAGTGLGLSMVYGIVRQSGGWIWVYSEPGHGTTFKIYLPRIDATPAPSAPLEQGQVSLRGSETVLVVEDQPEVLALISEVLEAYGYQVLGTRGGEEAYARCQQHAGPIQLLITDVVMPGMTGRELARRVASLRPEMKTLFISGYTANVIAHHGILEPGVSYLPKPFTPEGLAAKVREVLGE